MVSHKAQNQVQLCWQQSAAIYLTEGQKEIGMTVLARPRSKLLNLTCSRDTKIWSWVLTGPESMNECVCEVSSKLPHGQRVIVSG